MSMLCSCSNARSCEIETWRGMFLPSDRPQASCAPDGVPDVVLASFRARGGPCFALRALPGWLLFPK